MQLFPSPKASNKDALISTVGAALAVAVTWLVCEAMLNSVAPILALSMGASAVILFTMPTAPAAQPAPLIVAHCVAAFLGVLSAQLFDNTALAVGIASMRELGISDDIVNVNGGAIALGHPIGMSGNRLALTLLHELKRRGGGMGAAALCGGGGQGDALIVRTI